MRLTGLWATAGALLVLSVASADDHAPIADAKASLAAEPVIFATSYPLAYFAQRLASPAVRVGQPDQGAEGSSWRPSVREIQVMQRAALILVSDRARERWLDHVALPAKLVVDTTAMVHERLVPVEGETRHSHGSGGAHSHTATATNPWLDLTLAVAQARAVKDAMAHRKLGDGAGLDERFRALESDLLAIDRNLESITRDAGDVPILASAPAYAYLARRYGLHLENVAWKASGPPTDSARRYLERMPEHHRARWMIWPEEPDAENVALLRKLGIESLMVDTCTIPPENGDFVTVMRSNVEHLRRALQKQ